jgi:hypothetical protein
MTMTAVAGRDLDRYALVMSECDCGLCPPAPMWARRRGKSRRFTEPVTLMMAIEAEPSAARRVQMVQEHRQCLGQLLTATDELLALTTIDDLTRPAAGLALVMFSGELASALRAREFVLEPLPEALRQVCLETVTAAMSSAAGCLVMMTEVMELAAGRAWVLSGVL